MTSTKTTGAGRKAEIAGNAAIAGRMLTLARELLIEPIVVTAIGSRITLIIETEIEAEVMRDVIAKSGAWEVGISARKWDDGDVWSVIAQARE